MQEMREDISANVRRMKFGETRIQRGVALRCCVNDLSQGIPLKQEVAEDQQYTCTCHPDVIFTLREGYWTL